MDKLQLPVELVSLVHHIELNRAGWWDVAMQRLILASMWIAGKPLTLDQITDEANRSLNTDLDRAKVESQVGHLCQVGVLQSLSGDRFKISEQSRREFEKDVEEAEQVQQRAKSRFLDTVSRYCPDLNLEKTWRAVNDDLFLPSVREMGCRFYNLIAEENIEVGDLPSFQSFLSQYPPDVSVQLQDAITDYLSCGDSDVRSYVLHYLSAFFFVEAGKLDDDTIGALAASMGKLPSFKIFADTNFIFSVLGVHANPSDAAAQTALELARQPSDRVTIQTYAIPPTIEETRKAIQWRLDELGDLLLTPNMAGASLRRPEIGGFIRRLAKEAERLGHALTAKDYFGPYVTNLIQILRAKGIEFYNADLGEYRTKQAVIDDVVTQLSYERDRYGDGAKTYEKMLHDMILWHFVRDHRPSVIESPLEAEYWIATLDYRFLGFDAFKGGTLREEIPICLHPMALIQLLQFWVPRTVEFERTLYSSWLWPLLFQGFDPEMEGTTIRILKTLARFEDVGDIPTEVLDHVLVNQALRQRISSEREIASQIELVKDALIQETRRVAEELKTARHEAKEKESQIVAREQQIRDQDQTIESQKQKMIELEQKLEASNKTQELLSSQLTGLEEKINLELKRKERGKFVVGWMISPIIAIFLIGAGMSYGLDKWFDWDFWKTAIATWGILLIIGIWLTDRKGSSSPVIAEHHIFKFFHRFRNWFLGTVVVGVLLDLCAEAIKRSFWP